MDYQQSGGGNRGCYNCEFATLLRLWVGHIAPKPEYHLDWTLRLTKISFQAAILLIRYKMVMC